MFVHATLVESRQDTPLGFFAMCDVLVVVVGADVLDRQAWRLVRQTAARAGDKAKVTRLACQVVLAGEQVVAGRLTAGVAGYLFKLVRRGRPSHRRWHGPVPS